MAIRYFRLRLSTTLATAIDEALRHTGYGPRQKGVWVGEALEQLKREDPTLHKVGAGDDLDAPRDRSLLLSFARDHFRLLEDLVLQFREAAPLVEGVRALIVRSAIRSRIRSSKNSPGSYPRYPQHNYKGD